ncbi:MAG: short-chain dehydrogenase [Burkholderiales bacterium]|nr:short-chain dehydrogenase [Burkholderiales bacterium]
MKIEGSVALVTSTDHAFGAGLAQALLARGAAKVYAATRGAGSAKQPPGALPVMLDVTRPAQMSALARELGDVTLLVDSVVHFEGGLSPPAGADDEAGAAQPAPAGHCLQLVDAFAPVLAANGGGAVVNVLSVLSAGAFWHPGDSHGAAQAAQGLAGDGLRARLAAQGTELLFFRAALVVDAGSDDLLQGHWTLADHVARRVLDALESGDRPAFGRTGSTRRAAASGR